MFEISVMLYRSSCKRISAGYVNGIRLNYAQAMLDGGNESITKICYECGFESQRTFNRVFKERYRVTPREYKNANRKKTNENVLQNKDHVN